VRFTPDQWHAVRTVERHVLVAAGAGTGKTRTVVGRILYLLGVPVNGERVARPRALEEIAAITFTNAAAADLKRRLRDALRAAGRHADASAVDAARIGTIHGFCAELLREFALRSGSNPREEVLDEVAAFGLAAEAVRDAVVRAIAERRVAGLPGLLESWSVREVQEFVTVLLRDLGRLRVLLDHREEHDARERTLLDLAGTAAALLDRRLEARGAIDFDRIILRTRDLLATNPHALGALRRRLRVLVVDEFQDVDPIQKEIAYLLADPASGRDDTPRLMLVGDPKQSIYRFRRADVAVWTEVRRDFEERGYGVVVALTENFRSTAPILEFVDATAGKLLEQPVASDTRHDFEVPYERLVIAEAQQGTGAPVELLVVPAREDGRDYAADEVRRVEAYAVAGRARELVDRGEAGWGEMAIIIPSWSTVPLHRAALEAVGGHAFPLRTAGFFEQREIVDLLVALETVRDPCDDVALLGFLRSPFIGLSDEALLDIARQTEPPCWTGLDRVETPERDLLGFAHGLLARLVRLRDRIPTDELIEILLDETGYVAHLRLLGPDRFLAVANVDRFVRQARAAGSQTLGEFVRTLRDVRALAGEEGDVPIVLPKDAVTITTVHSAKGLEWKVVFWCDTVHWVKAREGGDLLVGRRRIALKDRETKPEDAPEAWRAIRDAIALEEYAERKRVWYVAQTRAAERLFVCGLPAGAMRKGARVTVADHLWRCLGEVPLEDGTPFTYGGGSGAAREGLVRLADPSVLAAAPAPTVEPAIESADVLPEPVTPLGVAAGRSRHSASELLRFTRCPRRHWFTYVMGVREPELERETAEFLDAVTRGRIVHDVLEHLRQEDELDGLLEDAIRRCDPDAPAPEQPAGRRYRRVLREEIRAVADHPEYRAVADLPTARHELRFLHMAGAAACFEGGIDLAALEDEELVLLDVKTTGADPPEARRTAAQFAPQRDVYVAAAEALSGFPVRRFAFQFSRARTQVSEPVTDAARRRLPDALRQAAREMEGGLPRLTEHPAECRFCGYRMVGWCPGVRQEPRAGATGPAQLALDLE
jgi:ATP-dependent helicase/nuclease subunit A